MKKKIFIFFILLFLFKEVLAFGVTPSRTSFDFIEGKEYEGTLTIINSDKEELNLVLYTQGDLAKDIYLTENTVKVSPTEESKQIKFKVKVPSNIKPGLNNGEIVIMNLPKQDRNGEAFVGATVAISHTIQIFKNYPGKYADFEVNILDTQEGVVFLIDVLSRGEHDIVSLKANIDIFNQLNEKIDSFYTKEISLNSGERKEIVHKWKPSNISVGKYLAKITLLYDGETKELEKIFRIGNPELELQNIEVKNFRLGDIAKFEMLIENKWSEQIKGAYTRMEIYDEKKQLISDVKSAAYDLEPFSKKIFTTFWDTAGVKEGDYEAKLSIIFGDISKEKSIGLKVFKDKIEIKGLGYVISSEKTEKESNIVFILIVLVVILILINIVWFLILRRRFMKK
ncbi:MAG: hypothetical protein QW273_03570 [Candidatus Pacearchaeota archaeon]